jgi:hypothetical protein
MWRPLAFALLLVGCRAAPPVVPAAARVTGISYDKLQSDVWAAQLAVWISITNPARSIVRSADVQVRVVANGFEMATLRREVTVPVEGEITATLWDRVNLAKVPMTIEHALDDQTAQWLVEGALSVGSYSVPIHHEQHSHMFGTIFDCTGDGPHPRECEKRAPGY